MCRLTTFTVNALLVCRSYCERGTTKFMIIIIIMRRRKKKKKKTVFT